GSLSTGLFPYGGGVFDGAGNLYGTTSTGGASSGGTVFELAAGSWTMRVLHNFSGGADGETSYAGLVLAAGNLYGTPSGGSSSGGTVFELTPAGGGNWTVPGGAQLRHRQRPLYSLRRADCRELGQSFRNHPWWRHLRRGEG